MNAKRTKFATLTAVAKSEHEHEIASGSNLVPVLVHNPNAGEGEPEYITEYAHFANAEEAESAVEGLHQVHDVHHLSHHHQLADNEVIIDEHGQAITIQQLVNDDGSTVEEVEAVEESDGVLRIVSSSHHHHHDSVVDSGEEGEEVEYTAHSPEASGSRGNAKQQYFCTNCGNCYSAAGSLKLHMRACLRVRPEVPPEERKCNLCQKVFNSVSYLKEHMLRHTGEGPRRCSRCYRKFLDDDKFQAHMESHKHQDKLEAEEAALAAEHGGRKVTIKEFTCSFCSENFTVVFDANNVKRRYACDACREKYSNVETLKQHKQAIDDKREFHCERCGRKFVFEGFLQRHLPTCDGTIKRRRDMK